MVLQKCCNQNRQGASVHSRGRKFESRNAPLLCGVLLLYRCCESDAIKRDILHAFKTILSQSLLVRYRPIAMLEVLTVQDFRSWCRVFLSISRSIVIKFPFLILYKISVETAVHGFAAMSRLSRRLYLSATNSQSITHSRLSQQIAWTGGIGFDLVAQIADVDAQHVHFTFIGSPPYLSK